MNIIKKKINLYVPCSKLSNFCGYNKYISQEECFFNAFKKSYPNEYNKILKKINHEDKNEQNKNIIKDLKFSNIINEAIKKGDTKSKNQTLQIVSKSLKEDLKKKCIPEIEQKRIIKNVKKQADFKIKTEIGIEKEEISLNKFEDENFIKITSRNNELFTDYIKTENVILKICGKIDGINEKNKILIEHKYRLNRLFDIIPMYERFQIYLYLYFTNMEKCILIQTFKNEQSILKIEWSDEEWKRIIDKIISSLEKFYLIYKDKKKLEKLVKKYTVKKIKNCSVKTLDTFFIKLKK